MNVTVTTHYTTLHALSLVAYSVQLLLLLQFRHEISYELLLWIDQRSVYQMFSRCANISLTRAAVHAHYHHYLLLLLL
jgi:hypothetical protein